MEVKPGYKQTEVGVIPEEWRDCDISDLCQLQRGFDLTEATRKRGDIPVYSSSGLSYFHNEARLQPPAVITGRKGLLGKVFFVEEPCWPHDTTLWVKDFKGNLPRFVALFLGQFRLERFDAATSVPTLNRNNVVGIPIKLPPLPEQRAIATALSDVDGLLGGLDRLIAKKRDLKQAAMQQLLTGQTRLPGFHGEWEVKRLDELGSCFAGGTPSTTRPDYWGGDVLWLPSGRVQNNVLAAPIDSEIRITRKGLTESAAKSIKPHSVLVAITGATCANVALLQFEAAANQSVVAIEPFDGANPNFLFYSLLMERGQILSRQSGSAQGGVNLKAVKGITIRSPSPPEQTAIAAVLTEMDAELAALEQRREKTRALKQAMMQELLTGRIQLV